MNFKEENVEIDAIDKENKTFEITTCKKISYLAVSIKNFGLINYPVLIKKNKSFNIISGFRRIAACSNIGWSHLTARIADSNTDYLTCIKIAIADNSMQRPLNLIEYARAFHLLSSCVDDNTCLAKLASELGLPDNYALINKIKQIYFLDPFIHKCIVDETISLSVACLLAKMESDEAIAFAKLFDQLKLSLNKQREIISLVEEISARDEINSVNLLQNDFFKQTLKDNDLEKNEKGQRIRRYLKTRRFPEIIKAEKEFNKLVKSLQLEGGIKLVPPRNFEGSLFTLSIPFKNIIELNKSIKFIDKIVKNSSLNKILS